MACINPEQIAAYHAAFVADLHQKHAAYVASNNVHLQRQTLPTPQTNALGTLDAYVWAYRRCKATSIAAQYVAQGNYSKAFTALAEHGVDINGNVFYPIAPPPALTKPPTVDELDAYRAAVEATKVAFLFTHFTKDHGLYDLAVADTYFNALRTYTSAKELYYRNLSDANVNANANPTSNDAEVADEDYDIGSPCSSQGSCDG